jgi:hypothetical protein
MERPVSPSSPRWAKRRGGSHAVTVDSIVKAASFVRAAPPSRGSTSFRPMNQESMPGPVVIASQTSSGVASTLISLSVSNG